MLQKSCLETGSARRVYHHGFELRHTWDQIRPLLSTRVGLRKLPDLSTPQFPHLSKGGNLIGCCGWLNATLIYQCWAQCLKCSKRSINAINTSISNDNAASTVIRITKYTLAASWVDSSWGPPPSNSNGCGGRRSRLSNTASLCFHFSAVIDQRTSRAPK